MIISTTCQLYNSDPHQVTC